MELVELNGEKSFALKILDSVKAEEKKKLQKHMKNRKSLKTSFWKKAARINPLTSKPRSKYYSELVALKSKCIIGTISIRKEA